MAEITQIERRCFWTGAVAEPLFAYATAHPEASVCRYLEDPARQYPLT